MTWLDTRGSTQIKKIVGGLFKVSGYGITNIIKWLKYTGGGPGLAGKDIIAHILWLKHEHPEIFAQTYKFLDCKDYLNFRLTGKIATSYDCGMFSWLVNTVDPTHFFHDPNLAKKFELDLNLLPELRHSIDILGTLSPNVASDLGLNPQTKVIMGAGDIATAAVGSGAIRDGEAHICIGSSSWIVTFSPKRRVDIFHMVGSIPSAIPQRFMTIGEQESAGINLTWLRDKILYNKDLLLQVENQPNVYKIFDKLVEEVPPGANNVIFTPWLFGERTPIEDHTIRGSLNNISLNTDRRHIIRAIFEGVAFNARWLLYFLEKMVHRTFDQITIVGGGGVSDVWCQIFADVLNRKICQVYQPKESNSIGCGFIGGVALGEITWDQIPNLVKIKHEFIPQESTRKTYDLLFHEFTQLYTHNKKMYQKLNQFKKD
jgi:xylulokinase